MTKNYSDGLYKQVAEFVLEKSDTDWYDLWQIHLDMKGENFPYRFEGVAWGIKPPMLLQDALNLHAYDIGQADYDPFLCFLRLSKPD